MKTKWIFFILYSVLAFTCLPASLLADQSQTKLEKTQIIGPGEAEHCASDFFVDNIGKEEADLKVVLGHKVYVDEILQPGERRAFDLPATINVARFRGREDLSMDDVAVIINLGPTAHMRLRCIDLRENPLKAKDPLATHK